MMFFLMIRRPPRSTPSNSSAASDVYKRQVVVDIDCLSTGCKTILNVLYFPNKVFCMKECGDNALEVLYGLENGAVYSDYAVIPFDMKEVRVFDKKGKRVISDYEELKEWWNNEK